MSDFAHELTSKLFAVDAKGNRVVSDVSKQDFSDFLEQMGITPREAQITGLDKALTDLAKTNPTREQFETGLTTAMERAYSIQFAMTETSKLLEEVTRTMNKSNDFHPSVDQPQINDLLELRRNIDETSMGRPSFSMKDLVDIMSKNSVKTNQEAGVSR